MKLLGGTYKQSTEENKKEAGLADITIQYIRVRRYRYAAEQFGKLAKTIEMTKKGA